ncbi:MAG: hypothetical protein RIB52_12200 [Erythrobacter sp.]|uniref:MSCRAMM family protein n=1 Tax=Erythrobacter sp. TaxID=1042 RepID=UPI0032EB07BC
MPAFTHFAARVLALVVALCLTGAAGARPPAVSPSGPGEPDVFESLFGSDPAAEQGGEAGDGLALPGLFADGRRIADTLPLHDLGPGGGVCVTIRPLLQALEMAYAPDRHGNISVTLPRPERRVAIPADTLIESPNGACLKLVDIPAHLPLELAHDPVSQRLDLSASAPLPVLIRLEREKRYDRLRPVHGRRPDFPLLERENRFVDLWSADLAAGFAHEAGRTRFSTSVQAAGQIAGMGARAAVTRGSEGTTRFGLTLSEVSADPVLLGPLGARRFALGDIASPAQPLIADTLTGRGLVVASRPPWRVDLVDSIELSGPLPSGWEAELWHEDRLVAVTREADALGQWRFADLPVRLGENRWVVRLHGPHGEMREDIFTRLVGSAMQGENEVEYAFGVVDAGTPLIGETANRRVAGPAAFASLAYGLAPEITARLDMRTGTEGEPAVALGLNGSQWGGLWAASVARDGEGSLAAAIRLARKFGSQDVVFDLARHGSDTGAHLPAQVREFSEIVSLEGQGRIGLGRFSLPWQLRLRSAQRRSGGAQRSVAGRIAMPFGGLQADAGLALVSENGGEWRGNAGLGLAGRTGKWRLRAGIDAVRGERWRLGSARLAATRSIGDGAMNLDLGWQAAGGFGAGLTIAQQIGAFGVSGRFAHGPEGFSAGVTVNVGLWRHGRSWRTAGSGVSRSGSIVAEMFVDENGDGFRDEGEEAIEGGRLLVGSAVRREETGPDGAVLVSGLPAGREVDVEMQLSSLDDFTLRPARAGERLVLRPGEVRALAVPLRPTGSLEAQVLLQAGDDRVPRPGVLVVLRDADGREVARAPTDFAGYVLFEGLGFGTYSLEAAGRAQSGLSVSRAEPDLATSLVIPAA